jgi:hypothetical protein
VCVCVCVCVCGGVCCRGCVAAALVAVDAATGAVVHARLFRFADELRERSTAAVRSLVHDSNLRVLILTGDHAASAQSVGDEVGRPGPRENFLCFANWTSRVRPLEHEAERPLSRGERVATGTDYTRVWGSGRGATAA